MAESPGLRESPDCDRPAAGRCSPRLTTMRFPATLLSLLLGLLVVTGSEPAAGQASAASPTAIIPRTILFLGDSLTAGYGLDNASAQAFPALIERRLGDAGRGGEFAVVNAGVSGDTTAGGLRRIDWLLSRRAPDIFILELGGNDGLRGLPPAETERNLHAIIAKVRARNPAVRVLVAGMMLPPSLGMDYVTRFAAVFPAVAKSEDAVLIPFILEGVGGRADLNQRDGIHPTAEGHRAVAEVVWRYLEPVLRAGGPTAAAR